MKAKKFDQQFEDDVDLTPALDLSKAKRVLQEQKRVNVDFPSWMVDSLDREASKLGVTRQSIIKVWIAERLEAAAPVVPLRRRSRAATTHVSKHGFWLLLADEELLVPFDQFPWFRKGTIEQISDVQWPTPDHLYWPGLDIDLSVQSIRNPSAFPLVSGAGGQ